MKDQNAMEPAIPGIDGDTRLALIDEISRVAVSEMPSARAFSTALERTLQTFGLDAVAVFAGEPLTLRLQVGGVPTRPGTAAPVGLVGLASAERQPIVSGDARADQPWSPPPWASRAARSEAAIPIAYRGRRIGILDLCSPRADGFTQADLGTLSTVAQLLAVIIAQESWGKGEGESPELQRAYGRLQEFSQLKAHILRNVSHELRTPLTVIRGHLELLMADRMQALLPEQRKALDVVCDRVDDIVTIVERTISLSPTGDLSLAYEKIIVSDLLRETVEAFTRRRRQTEVALTVAPVAADLYLYGDADKIRQLCYNLLDNAAKFSPNGGQVTIRAQAEDANVHITFADEGIGIPERQLSQIFETFYQVDGSTTRRFGGLGLGLTVVNRIVDAHKGEIWVESEVDRGSTFHVLLPKHVPQEQL
jgi:signal transduction histidine kinase